MLNDFDPYNKNLVQLPQQMLTENIINGARHARFPEHEPPAIPMTTRRFTAISYSPFASCYAASMVYHI